MRFSSDSHSQTASLELMSPSWMTAWAHALPRKLLPSIRKYCQLIASVGLNVRPGQEVLIEAEPCQRSFARLVARACHKQGASKVEFITKNRSCGLVVHDGVDGERFSELPSWCKERFNRVVERNGAHLSICGEECPGVSTAATPSCLAKLNAAWSSARRRLDDEGINQGKVQWCVVAAATPGWAKLVYPGLDARQAYLTLWEAILSSARVECPEPEEAWRAHDRSLRARATLLNSLKIQALRFSGPGTDLQVRLLPESRFVGGSNTTSRDVSFMSNIPTEEVYTTPDFRGTEGHFTITRPLLLNGTVVRGAELVFEKGRVVASNAAAGKETLREQISMDEGASRLGEVALVGVDSPIFQSRTLFHETLLDENATSHVALGQGYRDAIENGFFIPTSQLEDRGINDSSIHEDLMIGSEHTDVDGVIDTGARVPLLRQGRWVL